MHDATGAANRRFFVDWKENCGLTRSGGQFPDAGQQTISQDALIRQAALKGRSDVCAIAIMAKASRAGLVKTRLAPPLSREQAASLNTAFLTDIVGNLSLAGREAGIAPYLAFGPPGSAPFFEERFSREVGLIEIWFPNFGACLFHTLQQLLALGYGAACVLNSDSPTLPTARLVEAATLLAQPGDRAVLGPSTDGGYYLLGVKASHPRLFEDISWSTEVVAEQTMDRAGEIGLELVTLASWYDVDDAQSLERLASELAADAGGDHGVVRYAAPHTAEAMRALTNEAPPAETSSADPVA